MFGLKNKIEMVCNSFFKKILFIFRKKGREGEREEHWCERETSIGCLLYAPRQGPNPQPRHVPWLGIKPKTFHFAGWRLAIWATPVRTVIIIFLFGNLSLFRTSWLAQGDHVHQSEMRQTRGSEGGLSEHVLAFSHPSGPTRWKASTRPGLQSVMSTTGPRSQAQCSTRGGAQ